MAAAAAALPLALPLAEKGIQASVDLTRSVIAQVFDAMRTPLLGWERTTMKITKGGKSVRTMQKMNLPAWFVLGGAITALIYFKPFGGGGGGDGGGGGYTIFGINPLDPFNISGGLKKAFGWDWWLGPFGLH